MKKNKLKSVRQKKSKGISPGSGAGVRTGLCARRHQQLLLFNDKVPRLFGGGLMKSHAKRARPLTTKEPIHLVLKSKQAIGSRSMLHSYNAKKIDAIIRGQAKLSGISIYHLVNVGNHLHAVIRITNLNFYGRFIRSVTGLIARHVMKSERGSGQKFLSESELNLKNSKLSDGFWVARPFTRLIAWGRDYRYVKNYIEKNRNQSNLRNYFMAWGFDITEVSNIQYLSSA